MEFVDEVIELAQVFRKRMDYGHHVALYLAALLDPKYRRKSYNLTNNEVWAAEELAAKLVSADGEGKDAAGQRPAPCPAPTWPSATTPSPPWGRWLDRDTNGCLTFKRIKESMQRPMELCSWTDREALPPVGYEYQQGYKLVNDRLPKVRQRLHRAAEYRRGIDGRARNNP
ncbi:hypothetical protein QJQ45_001721 [Haematococcus lacustris]|nr:hypothetical protein QJQ45_001721 [Haematococcus lacustris]